MRKVLVVIILFSLISCKMMAIPFKRNNYAWTNFKVPDGTPAFQAGYKAGCAAITYARGNVFYRSRYDYHYDIRMIDNADYKSGYSRGWGWCFGEVAGTDPVKGVLGSGLTGPYAYPHGEHPLDTNPGDVQEAWGGFFGSSAPNIIETGNGLDGSFEVWGGSGSDSAFGANPLWSSGKARFMGIW